MTTRISALGTSFKAGLWSPSSRLRRWGDGWYVDVESDRYVLCRVDDGARQPLLSIDPFRGLALVDEPVEWIRLGEPWADYEAAVAPAEITAAGREILEGRFGGRAA